MNRAIVKNTAMNETGTPLLSGVDTWVFDLDNTLYPASQALFPQIEARIGAFVSGHLGIVLAEAQRLQKTYFREFGSTLRGLMTVHQTEPSDFLEFVHDIDYGALAPDPRLDDALGRLAGRKFIYTNASAGHAERVMNRLGVSHHFEAVFDIEAAGYLPKPDPGPYGILTRSLAIDPKRAAMFEDIARNLAPAAAVGMTTIWLPGSPAWASEGAGGDHIHYVAEDLPAWLEAVVATRSAAS